MEYAARFDCSEHGFGAISIEKIYPARAGIQKKSALIFPSLWQAVKQLADQYNQAERQRAKVAQTRRDMDSITGINNFDRSDLKDTLKNPVPALDFRAFLDHEAALQA